MRWGSLFAVLLFGACHRPEVPTTSPGQTPSGVAYPDLGVTPPAREPHPKDVAVIITVEDYTKLRDRPGAVAAGAAWYKYFREVRGLAPRRILWAANAAADPRTVIEMIERARSRARPHSTLWFVFVGHISSGTENRYGELWLRDGDGTAATMFSDSLPLDIALGRLAYGVYPRMVAVLDGCLDRAGRTKESRTSGSATPQVPALFQPPSRPRQARESPSPVNVMGAVLHYLELTLAEAARARRMPSDVAIFTAGYGPACAESLPGSDAPALSYLVLAGLRGWADRDGDGTVTATELLAHTATLLRAGSTSVPLPSPSAFGADLALATGVREQGLTVAQMQPPEVSSAVTEMLRIQPLPVLANDPRIRIPGGWFAMGCPRDRRGGCERDERPNYRVHLSRFHIDANEITNAEYQDCVDRGLCSKLDVGRCYVWTSTAFGRGEVRPEPLTRPDHPVVCATWAQAQNYCLVHGGRLPTEAEWERAAAGTTGRRYPWGDEPATCDRAHFDDCGDHTRPVGQRPAGATPEGVHDLAGNVAEWVLDWYDRHAYVRPFRSDPTGPSEGIVRVVRGGSYYDSTSTLRASYRYGLNPISGFSTVGFRCAR